MVGFYLAQKRYGEDYSDIVACAQDTIMARQAPNGGYYKTVNTTAVEIWYTDNIGVSLPWYLNRVSTPLEKARGFTFMLNKAHLASGTPKFMESVIEQKVIALGRSCNLPPEKGGYANFGGTLKVSAMIKRWIKPEFQPYFIEFAYRICPEMGSL